jgi:hypothetical protein
MARLFTLADVSNWPPYEQRVFVLEHLIRVQEDDLVRLEATGRSAPQPAQNPPARMTCV